MRKSGRKNYETTENPGCGKHQYGPVREGANSIPNYGESLLCRHYGYAPGGKGSNQAFALAKQGADVVFVGCIGDDDNGRTLKESLDHAGVNTD